MLPTLTRTKIPSRQTRTAVVEPKTPAPERSQHLGYLDALRALAALYVLFDHAALQIWPRFTSDVKPEGLAGILSGALLGGHYAVSLFIVISGFCLMLPIIKGDGTIKGGARTFFKKRARRILPPYYLAMGVSLLLIGLLIGQKTGTHWDSAIPVSQEGFFAHLFLIQNIYGAPQINHVFWSIAVEWQIYFLFPALVLLWKRMDGLKVTLASVALAYAGVLALRGTHSGITPQYFGLFAMGMMGCAIAFSKEERWKQIREKVRWMPLLIGSTAIAGALIYLNKTAYADLFVGVSAVALIVASAKPGVNGLNTLLSWKPLVFVGTFAYSLYLIHAPLLQVVWQYAIRPLQLGELVSFGMLAFIGCPLIVGGCYLFFLACERPFLTKKPARTGVGI